MQMRAGMMLAALLSLLAACGGGDSANSSSGPGTTPTAPQSASDVSITINGPSTAVAGGGSTTIEIVVDNAGPDAARNVTVIPAFAAGLTYSGATCTASGGATCPTLNTLSVASLPAQGRLRFALQASVAHGQRGSLVASATVSSDNERNTANNTSSTTLSAYQADLVVAGVGPGTVVAAGGTAVYTMGLSNAGPDAAFAVQLDNVVGAGQTLRSIACTATGGAVCPVTLGANLLVPSLPVGGALSFTVTTDVHPTTIGSVANVLYAAQAGDPLLSNNVATAWSPASIPSAGQSFIQLRSDAGDWVGNGQSYSYTKATAVLGVTVNGERLSISVNGDEWWNASIALPTGYSQLQPGTYSASRFGSSTHAGLDWGGEGRGCNSITGTLVIDSVTYTGGTLNALDLHFEQHCEGGGPALHGQVHWSTTDTTTPAGPVTPPPTALWRAPAGATPASGNYVYLQSDAGDFIGAGRTATYTQANAVLTTSSSNGLLQIGVAGNDDWRGELQGMNTLNQLVPGFYGGLQRYPFHNPTRGGLSWGGNGRGCNTLTGWFVIDSISYVGNTLSAVDARFEQHCEGGGPALRGQIHWVAGDPTAPPGPQTPPPAGLWNAPAGATPASGNYIYLSSETGDYIGGGQTSLYTPATSTVVLTGSGRNATVMVDGFGGWSGNFVAMNSIAQLAPGYYGGLQRFPFHNQAAGGLDWSGNGRGCNTLSGWFVVDSVSYINGNIASLDLRFEQHCEGMGPALRGKIHWIN